MRRSKGVMPVIASHRPDTRRRVLQCGLSSPRTPDRGGRCRYLDYYHRARTHSRSTKGTRPPTYRPSRGGQDRGGSGSRRSPPSLSQPGRAVRAGPARDHDHERATSRAHAADTSLPSDLRRTVPCPTRMESVGQFRRSADRVGQGYGEGRLAQPDPRFSAGARSRDRPGRAFPQRREVLIRVTSSDPRLRWHSPRL